MAVAIGVPETAVIAAGAGAAAGEDEFTMAGAFDQRPLALVKCKTVDLEVPADAEIVVEGFICNGERAEDGPYMDYSGKAETNRRAFVFEATSLWHRDRAVFRGASIGAAGAEDHQLFAVLAELGLVDFHGSRLKQRLQNFFLRERRFESFQRLGRISNPLR